MTGPGGTTTLALCIPAYNAEATLPRLFESARAQTEAFDEIWLYDDASADGTAKLAEELGAAVVRGAANVGCSAGKNALLSRVQSAWVHFHDADDLLHPEFAARAKTRVAEGEFDAILFDYEQVDEVSGQVISRSHFADSPLLSDPVPYMLRETVNNGGAYRTDFVRRAGGFDGDSAVSHNEDRAFHLRLAELGARFAVEPYVGCRFYYHRGSMSATNQAKCSLANQEITRRFAERHPGQHLREVGDQSWRNAGALASFLEWQAADAAVELAVASTGRIPGEGSLLFRSLCALSGPGAIRARERLIRWLKPRYRLGYPR